MKKGRKALKKGREKQFGSKQVGKKRFEEVTGRVQMTRDGYVFVIVEGDTDNDIFVKASKTRGALNGDTVKCVVTREKTQEKPAFAKGGKSGKGSKGKGFQPVETVRRREGEIVEIVERSHLSLIHI